MRRIVDVTNNHRSTSQSEIQTETLRSLAKIIFRIHRRQGISYSCSGSAALAGFEVITYGRFSGILGSAIACRSS